MPYAQLSVKIDTYERVKDITAELNTTQDAVIRKLLDEYEKKQSG